MLSCPPACVFSCLACFACLRAWHALCACVIALLSAHVLMYLGCLSAHVFMCLACLCVCFACLHPFLACLLCSNDFCAYVLGVLLCLFTSQFKSWIPNVLISKTLFLLTYFLFISILLLVAIKKAAFWN